MAKRSPKSIGTHGESAVLKVVQEYFPKARREVLHGDRDLGDIMVDDVMIVEVKAGKQTATIGDSKLTEWLGETQREAVNAALPLGILVVQRAGFGEPRADRWWAYMTVAMLGDILGAAGHKNPDPVRMELGHLLSLLADQGYTPDAAE